jgi:hypothetical protein
MGQQPLPMAVPSKAQICSHSVAGTAGSNPTQGMDVRLLLGAFAKLRKATLSFVWSVRPSVRPH